MNTTAVEPIPSSISVNGTAAPGSQSAVAWAAVLAGAAGAIALSLILLILGTGLGLSSVSPWAHYGARATTIGVSAIAWIIFTQFAAAGLGGYLAGRLRTRWTGVPTDEVYFRDTAHGFLAWSVATFITAALLTSTIGGLLNRGVEAGAIVAGTAATAGATAIASGSSAADRDRAEPTAYTVDSLFGVGFQDLCAHTNDLIIRMNLIIVKPREGSVLMLCWLIQFVTTSAFFLPAMLLLGFLSSQVRK